MHRSLLFSLVVLSVILAQPAQRSVQLSFDGATAMGYLQQQCDFGPRPPGSTNLSSCREYIVSTLGSFGWDVRLQNFTYRGVACANIIARGSPDAANISIVLGAHYDTRPVADQDPDPANRQHPILGANDGASGVAVLLELARVLPVAARQYVELVFFDAEDSGGVNGWEWIVGSTYYVGQLDDERRAGLHAMILLDMVGDSSAQFLRERSSTRTLQDNLWSIAAELGYSSTFIDSFGAYVIDDHTPFLDAGMPAVDIIQNNPFPPYWHTLADTPDKCSASSLERVGSVVEMFVLSSTNETDATPASTTSPLLFYVPLVGLPLIVLVTFLMVRRVRSRETSSFQQ